MIPNDPRHGSIAGYNVHRRTEIAGITKPDRYAHPTHTRGDTAA